MGIGSILQEPTTETVPDNLPMVTPRNQVQSLTTFHTEPTQLAPTNKEIQSIADDAERHSMTDPFGKFDAMRRADGSLTIFIPTENWDNGLDLDTSDRSIYSNLVTVNADYIQSPDKPPYTRIVMTRTPEHGERQRLKDIQTLAISSEGKVSTTLSKERVADARLMIEAMKSVVPRFLELESYRQNGKLVDPNAQREVQKRLHAYDDIFGNDRKAKENDPTLMSKEDREIQSKIERINKDLLKLS